MKLRLNLTDARTRFDIIQNLQIHFSIGKIIFMAPNII